MVFSTLKLSVLERMSPHLITFPKLNTELMKNNNFPNLKPRSRDMTIFDESSW